MPCLTTRFLIGISISTQLGLFGIVETKPRKTCVCTTTLSSSLSSTETFTSPSMTKSSTSSTPFNTSTTTSTSSNTSTTTSATPSNTSTTISTIPSNTSSTTSTTPSNTSATTTTVRSNTSTTTPATLFNTSTTARTTPSNSMSTTQNTPQNTSSATSTIPSNTSIMNATSPSNTSSTASTIHSNTSSATSPTLLNTSNTSSAASTILSNTPSTTLTTLSNTSSTTSTTPSNTSNTTSAVRSNTSTTTPTTLFNTSTKARTTPSNSTTMTQKTPSNTSSTTSTTGSNTSSTTSKTPSNQSSTTSATPSNTPSMTGNSLGFRGPDGVCICSSTLEHISSTSNKNESAKVLSLDKVPVKVPLVVSINTDFKKELLDKSSMLYKKYKAEFKSKLEVTYKDMDDFLRVDVLGFRNGCIACDYVVVLQPGSVLEDTDIQNKTNSLNSEEIFNISMQTESTSIVIDFKKLYKNNPCRTVDCGYGYSCASTTSALVTCEHLCSSWNMCQNDGLCLLDDRHELPFCRCKTDDQYTYSGDYCEVKNEKFALSKTYIIAIAAGSGGGLLTILFVIILVLALKRKSNGNNKERDEGVGHMKSVSMDDLRLDRMNDSRSSNGFLHRPRIHASENQYESGFPDTKYVQGREHRVMKDSRGDETYIYQPSSYIHPVSRTRDGSAYSNYVAGPSVYDYIDTESKFEIQRPNIRLGNMNKY